MLPHLEEFSPKIEAMVSSRGEPWVFDRVVDLPESLAGESHNHPIAILQGSKGKRVFVKQSKTAHLRSEASGLALLNWYVRTPRVYGICTCGDISVIVEEHLVTKEYHSITSPEWEAGGVALARLHHDSRSDAFGLDWNAYLGPVLLKNSPRADTWAPFYGANRLQAEIDRIAEHGTAMPPALLNDLARLISNLPSLVGPAERPSLLHGDLWLGNLVFDDEGPVFIDPAPYYGHREVDVTYTEHAGYTKGIIPEAFRAAYHETYPLQPGHEARKSLYWVYYWLLHVDLHSDRFIKELTASVDDVLKGSKIRPG